MLKLLLLAAVLLPLLCHASIGFSNCSTIFVPGGAIPDQPEGAVQVCREGAIAISYDTKMMDPAWSAYYITPYEINHEDFPGRDSFYEDPDLEKLNVRQASVRDDVWSETWNKGHLCPSETMSYSASSKKATYTMANVSPQYGQFNQVGWNALENHVMAWVKSSNRALHIITGIMYDDRSNARRAKSGVAYADYYFKVLCDAAAGKSVGFYGKNAEGSTPADEFHTVAEVEKIYGGTLFPAGTCNTSKVEPGYWWGKN